MPPRIHNWVPLAAIVALALGLFLYFRSSTPPAESAGLVAKGDRYAESGSVEPRAELPASGPQDPAPANVQQAEVAAARVELVAPAKRKLTFATMEVTVTDSLGAVVPGVRVVGFHEDADAFSTGFHSSRTNAEGQAKLIATRFCSGYLIAEHKNWATTSSPAFVLSKDRPVVTVQIVMSAGGTVFGTLTDLHGQVAAQTPVALHLRVWPDGREQRAKPVYLQTTTNAAGRFQFEKVTPGNHTVSTRPNSEQEEWCPAAQIEIEVFDGQFTRVQFPGSSSDELELTGLVLRNGVPLVGAFVSFYPRQNQARSTTGNTKTDAAGRFHSLLPSGGLYRVFVNPPGGGPSFSKEFEFPEGITHDIELGFATGRITGHVVQADGGPASGAAIRAYGHQALTGAMGTAHARADDAGYYELNHLPEGSYRVQASGSAEGAPRPLESSGRPFDGEAGRKDLDVRDGASLSGVDLTLGLAAAISGRVQDGFGKSIGNAIIYLEPVAQGQAVSPRMLQGDDNGRFLAGGLPPGAYLVRAERDQSLSPWVPVTAEVNQVAEVRLVLERGTTLHISAMVDGKPLDNQSCVVRDENGRGTKYGRLDKGKVQIGPLSLGTYRIQVDLPGDADQHLEQSVRISGEATQSVQFRHP